MSLKMKLLPLAIAQVVAGGALTVLSMAPAMAQQVSADSQQPIQRVEITGSNIRRADAETPSPVQVISADDLQKSGYTTVSQVLQNITANGQGTLSQGFAGAFAGGATGISLRGLNTSATLVLIDGHRMAPNPLSDDGQRSFVDISNLPFDAIERVEVLKDGASAVYGSDAMAGVVNIILKKSFVGTKVNAEGGTSTEGGGATVHASVIHGFGDFENDGYNAYFSLEYRHQDPITMAQRQGDGLWSSADLSSVGGVNRTPGLITSQNPAPATLAPYLTNPLAPTGSNPLSSAIFNPNASACPSLAALNSGACSYTDPHFDVEPRTQNINLLASFSKKLADGWKLDVKGSIFDSQASVYAFNGTLDTFPGSYSQGSGQGGLAVSAGVAPHLVGPGSIGSITVPAGYLGIVPNSWTSGATVNGVIPGAPAPRTDIDNRALRLVADLTGTIGAWDIDSSLGWTKVGTNQNIYGAVNTPALNAALNRATNPFNIYGGNSAADMATIFPDTSAYDTSLLEFAEFHATRTLMQLPGGDLGFSTGASFIHRDMESPAPLLIAEGVVNGNNAYVSGAQNDASAYVELAAPVLKTLEIDGDVRFDHFNNAGNATTPKLAFKWTPTNEFALRGTVSQGFRAPNAAENGNSGQSYLAQTTYDPVLCPGGPNANAAGTGPAKGSVVNLNGNNLCNYEPVALNSATPNLSPEKSVSETLGVILEPIKGWSSTVDLYQIRIKDQIVAPALNLQTAVPVRGSPVQALCSDGNGGTYACTTSVGPVLYYPAFYANANSTTTSGMEIGTRYRFKLGEYGTLKAELDWSHEFSYILNEGGVPYQLAGTHGPSIIGGDTGNPKDRVQATFTWDKGPWEVATAFNWISSFDLTDASAGVTSCAAGGQYSGDFPAGNVPSQYCRVGSFLDTDVSMKYVLDKHWSFHGSITNLFNQDPPIDAQTYGATPYAYNPSMHLAGAIGRTVNVGASYGF